MTVELDIARQWSDRWHKRCRELRCVFKFEVGEFVKDKLTEFGGVIISRTEEFGGARGYSVQSRGLENSTTVAPVYFSEARLERAQEYKMAGFGIDKKDNK